MKLNMKLSPVGAEAICAYESFRSSVYRDGAGIWTIGYGFTRYPKNVVVTASTPSITKAAAIEYFRETVVEYETAVNHAVTVELRQGQFDALVSLCYNIGRGNFAKSELVKAINAGDPNAGEHFTAYVHDKNGKIEPGLVTRRRAEKAMFDRART